MLVGYVFLSSAARPVGAAHSTATNTKVPNAIVLTSFRFIDFLPRVKWLSRSFLSRGPYITGAAVPSDHLPTEITNSVMGSGPSRNCGFSVTGESGRSAPQEDLSVSGK